MGGKNSTAQILPPNCEHCGANAEVREHGCTFLTSVCCFICVCEPFVLSGWYSHWSGFRHVQALLWRAAPAVRGPSQGRQRRQEEARLVQFVECIESIGRVR